MFEKFSIRDIDSGERRKEHTVQMGFNVDELSSSL